jgi:hypothetical protein
MMMNCMGTGTGSSVVGGLRLADWAIALTYLFAGLLLVVAMVAVARILFFALPEQLRSRSDPETASVSSRVKEP